MKKNLLKAILPALCAALILTACGYSINSGSLLEVHTYSATFYVYG